MSDQTKARQLRGYNIVNFNEAPDYNKYQTANRQLLSQQKQALKDQKQHPVNLQLIKTRVSKEKYLQTLKNNRLSNNNTYNNNNYNNDNNNNKQVKTISQKNLITSLSTDHNFVNNCLEGQLDQFKLKQKEDQIAYKKHSIAQFADLTRLNCTNFNPQHQAMLTADPKVFSKTKAYCSQRCKQAKDYGLSKPFRTYKYTNN